MDFIDADKPSGSNIRVVTRKIMFDKMQQHNLLSFDEQLEYLENNFLSSEYYSDSQQKDIQHRFSYIKSQFKQRWAKAHRKVDIFLKHNEQWLQGTFSLPKVLQSHSSGRPQKTFSECSDRSKRRKTEEIRKSVDNEVLLYAAQTSLQTSGQRNASNVLKDLTSSPKRASKYKKAFHESQKGSSNQLTPEQALSMFIEADLSRRQYEVIRSSNKKYYPSYSVLQRIKNECYPPKESYLVTETCAEVNLQDLLDHTAKRLLYYLKEMLDNLIPEDSSTLTLISKWGCDGSQQAQFKQKMLNDASDANIFQSCFVPLQLIYNNVNEKKVIWQNPTPSSPRYCRPIRIRFVKESVDITNEEINYIENAINQLQNSEVILEKRCSVKHVLQLTMVDAKVCNAATQTTSTMRCYICGATSKEFNNLNIKLMVDTDALTFGLSILHARIRLFESILHLSYKLTIKKWQIRGDNDKAFVKQRKTEIQEAFRRETGLIIDVPKAGFRNTNDGNTSRRFFANPQLASEITGINFELIYRLKVILEVMSCGHKVNLKKFAEYGIETARLYIELYPWQPMTPTLHKILVHGATVMKHALLPIGLLSEEAAEARNKHFRLYRQDFSRKFSREICNLDVINRLLLSSDPFFSSMRPKPRKTSKPFLKETMDMLLPADPNSSPCTDSESGEDLSDHEE